MFTFLVRDTFYILECFCNERLGWIFCTLRHSVCIANCLEMRTGQDI